MKSARANEVVFGRPVERRDRPWVDTYVTIVCGPFDMPSTDSLRDAVAQVYECYPQSRLRWGFEGGKTRWTHKRDVESVVVDRGWAAGLGFDDVIDHISEDPTLEPPLTLVRYPDYFGMKVSHSLGDGPTFTTVLASALLTAVTGEQFPWPSVAGGRLPLMRAGIRTFGRHPNLLRTAMRDRFVPAGRPAQSMSSPSAWSRSRRTVYRSVPAKLAAQVYEHCAATSPNASKFGVQAALLLGALKKVGLAISPDVRVMVDLRRYLGAGLIDGNFFAGVPMKIHSDMTPTEITTTTRRTKESGRPLLNQMLTSTRLGKPVPVPTERTPGELPQVTFSFLGAPPTVQMLPFVTGERPVYAASVEPAGPDGLTFVHGECAGQMILNACFHDNVIDADLMNEVLDLVVTDPLALLSEQR